MKDTDRRIVEAMGDRFATFQRLARHAFEHPEDRAEMEVEMAKVLATMSQPERLRLRRALIAGGVR